MATEAEQAVQYAPTLAFIDHRFQDVSASTCVDYLPGAGVRSCFAPEAA